MKIIDAESLRKHLQEKVYPEKYGERCNPLDVINGMLQVIDDEPTIPQFGKWISAKDHPPDPEETVIVLSKGVNTITGKPIYFRSMGFYEDGKILADDSLYTWYNFDAYYSDDETEYVPEGWWEHVNYDETFTQISDEVIGWMPMPDEPEERHTGGHSQNLQ